MSKVKPDRRADIEHDAKRDAQTGNFNPPHESILGGEKLFSTEREREERLIYKKEHIRHKK